MSEAITKSATGRMGDFLETHKKQIEKALPSHLKPDRFLRIALTSFSRTPKLHNCTLESFAGAVVQAAQLGLEIGLGGEAHIVPFKNTCQLIPGYQGLMKLARQSPEAPRIIARVVKEKDAFSYCFGLAEKLDHTPATGDRGKTTCVYAIARFKDGSLDFEVMDKAEVDAIKARSRAGGDGPWQTDYDEMAKKTVIRRICKRLPSSTNLQRAIALEEMHDAGQRQHNEATFGMDAVEDTTWIDLPAEPTATEGLAAKLQAKANPNENRKKIPDDLPPLTFDELTDEEKAAIIAQEKADEEKATGKKP